MSTQAIERNYRKNPHTARFLQTFHSAISSDGVDHRAALDDNAAEYALAAQDDLLNLVPTEAPAYKQTQRQTDFISDLVRDINSMDTELGEQAASYIGRMERAGAWTAENTTRWIDRLIAKRAELRRLIQVTPPPATQVADGRYAVEEDGVLKFFKVKNGGRPGFVFLDI